MDYLSIKEIALQWNIGTGMVSKYCVDNRIPGAKKEKGKWLIPSDAVKPIDARRKITVNEEPRFTFVDLFCGIGGFHQAMASLGGKCVFACDINELCRKVYEENYKTEGDDLIIASDIKKVAKEKNLPQFDILCGGFPCQTFSKAGKQNGFKVVENENGETDDRGQLFFRIVDILQDEATEDIEMMAAITPTDKPYLKTSVFEIWKKRIPWLLLLMISATFTTLIISSFESALAAHIVLTSFIPMIMGTGGNSGSQSSTTVIRGISLGEIEFGDTLRVLFKELRVSVLCGICLAAATFGKVMLIDAYLMGNPQVTPLVALVVSLTLLVTVVAAKLIGCLLPIIAKKVRLDPAVMASPFITTIVDTVTLMIYFTIASALLGI